MAVQRVRLFFKLSLMQLVTASLLICMVPTISNAEESMCKGLKPFSNLDELLYQFYINLDSDCLFTMPVVELEKVWDIKILTDERAKSVGYAQLRDSSDFRNKSFESEKDAFYVAINRDSKSDTNVFSVHITNEYNKKYGTLFPEGGAPRFLPEPLKILDLKEIYNTPASNLSPHKPEWARNQSKYYDNSSYTYYWLNDDQTHIIKLNGIEGSVTGITILNYVMPS